MSKESATLECLTKVQQWLSDLETERKCNFTNAVCKSVGKLEADEQREVVSVISQQISSLMKKKEKAEDARKACNVINGCFDNFPHAVEAVSGIFEDVMTFLADTLEECRKFFRSTSSFSMNKIDCVDLTHTVSRLGTLVLKLRRRDGDKCPNIEPSVKKSVFPRLAVSCTQLICEEEALAIDTKINLAMVLWLMKEVATSSLEKLTKVHCDFLKTLPKVVEDEAYNNNLVKFMMAAAAVNLWTEPIIMPKDTTQYLNFFLSLCESFSSDTPILLMACRALQVLGKHKSFVAHCPTEAEVQRLVACNLMLLEHPVACARHSGRDLLQVLVRIPALQPSIRSAVLAVSPDRKSFYIGLASLALVTDTREMVKVNPGIPKALMAAISDSTTVSHVAFAVECLALHDSLVDEDSSLWCDLWVMPLLHTLSLCPPIVAADIEKLLLKIFKEKPLAIVFILEMWKYPDSDEKLRGILICLKLQNKLKGDGAKFVHLISGDKDEGAENVLKMCMTHGEDDIRLSAFSLIAEGSLMTQTHLETVLHFIKYNLNNHKPATRQKVIALFKKLLTRVNICYLTLLNPSKNRTVDVTAETYVTFLKQLVNFCYSNIFAGANFNRLNTVLSILSLCCELLDPSLAAEGGLYDAKHWPCLLVALSSSYEENKVMAVQLAKGLPFKDMEINDPQTLRLELRRAFGLIQELEPPSVLLGSYLLTVLLCAPSSGQVLKLYFSDCIENPSARSDVLCIQVLSRYLTLQLEEARESKLKAAREAPMYGTMFAVRLLLKQLDSDTLRLDETKRILQDLVGIAFNVADVVSSVVNNSSPEGHLPMDFQRLIEENGSEDRINDSHESEKVPPDLKSKMAAYKMAQSAEEKLRLAGSIRSSLEAELEQKLAHDAKCFMFDPHSDLWRKSILETRRLLAEYDCYYKFFEGHLPRIIEERPVTAQALLLYSWRSMKEACLFLGDLVSKLPLKDALEQGLLTEDLIIQIGLKLRLLLSEMKHRGAFEQADVAFSALCNALWACPIPSLQKLPSYWLEEVLQEMRLSPQEQSLKFTSTRRSAGLPFLVQAIIATEVSSNYSTTARCLQQTMETLLAVAEDSQSDHLEPRLHALNILRSLFKHAQLGEFVAPYVSRALQVAIRGSRSPTWPERNCSNLLFSALVVRIFGVARSRDHLSKKNKMTSRVFFQRFPELHSLFTEELTLVDEGGVRGGVRPQPSLYLVLLLMGRLYPPSTQDAAGVDLAPFVRLMARCAANPILRIRVLAARALVPFLPPDRIPSELSWRLRELQRRHGVSNNLRHGLLLQVVELFEELKKHPDLMPETYSVPIPTWMLPGVKVEKGDHKEENPVAECTAEDDVTVPLPVVHTLVDLLSVLCRYFPKHKENPVVLAISPKDWSFYTYWGFRRDPGADGFLAALLSLQLEVLAETAISREFLTLNGRHFLKQDLADFPSLVHLKNCGLEAVEDVVLQFIYCALTPEPEKERDFDFSLTEGMIENMKCFSSEERREILKSHLDVGWEPYVSSEKLALPRSCNIQQRRLRVLILGRIIQEYTSREDEIQILQLLSLYASYWEPDCGGRILAEPCNDLHFTDSVYGRLCSAMEVLMDGDRPCRLALAAVFKLAWVTLYPQQSQLVVEWHKYLLYLFRLLVDEDEDVRRAAQCPVLILSQKLDEHEWLEGLVTPLVAQEALLKSFISYLSTPNGTTAGLLLLALLTFTEASEDFDSDPLEIFKRGNPNPYSETLALTRLFTEACRNSLTKGALDKNFPGESDTVTVLHSYISPHFARYGLRLKTFKTPMELLKELERLPEPDNCNTDIFWCQSRLLLTLLEDLPK